MILCFLLLMICFLVDGFQTGFQCVCVCVFVLVHGFMCVLCGLNRVLVTVLVAWRRVRKIAVTGPAVSNYINVTQPHVTHSHAFQGSWLSFSQLSFLKACFLYFTMHVCVCVCVCVWCMNRYNNAGKLMETHRGRCGEWAQVCL